MFSEINSDLQNVISDFLSISTLSVMMCCNKKMNLSSMEYVGHSYNIETPKESLMTMTKVLTPETRVEITNILPGNAEAVFKKTCRICEKPGAEIFPEYGFVAHELCVLPKERLLLCTGIDPKDVRFSNFRSRTRKNKCNVNSWEVGIIERIPGIFPRKFSIKGQMIIKE